MTPRKEPFGLLYRGVVKILLYRLPLVDMKVVLTFKRKGVLIAEDFVFNIVLI